MLSLFILCFRDFPCRTLWKTFSVLALCTLFFFSDTFSLQAEEYVLKSLPQSIYFKTPTQTFNQKDEFVVFQGKVFTRKRCSNLSCHENKWNLLGATGFPEKKGKAVKYFSQQKVREISADGDNLIVIADDGHVFYTKVFNYKWKIRWGMPPKIFKLPSNSKRLAWSISHRGPIMKYYRGIDGNPHPTSAGVTTLYLLDSSGTNLKYADPWIPAKFGHQVDLPWQNRFRARNMNASASTLFVVNDFGDMFTRLYDFDTSGQNPVLPYSYSRENRAQGNTPTRSLPNEPWAFQPEIPGLITEIISIEQKGEGNDSFELKVEGFDQQGRAGYYVKMIRDKQWNFVITNHNIIGKRILKNKFSYQSLMKLSSERAENIRQQDRSKILGPIVTRDYSRGVITRKFKVGSLSAKLLQFSTITQYGLIKLSYKGKTHYLELHLRRVSEKNGSGKYKTHGMILLPKSLTQSHFDSDREIFKSYFGENEMIPVEIKVTGKKIKLVEDLEILSIPLIGNIYVYTFVHPTRNYEIIPRVRPNWLTFKFSL